MQLKILSCWLFKILADASAVISGAQLGLGILTTILNTLGSISRKVAIGVDNESGYKWRAVNIYFYSGTSDRVLPRDVSSGKININNIKV